MAGISYDQLIDIYHASEKIAKAWPNITVLQMARLVWNLRQALGYETKRNGNGRIDVTELPEEATAGLTCSLSGG